MLYKKGDKVVLIDADDIGIIGVELYGVYTVDSYTKTDNIRYEIMSILIIDEVSGAFDANRFISFGQYRKQKLNKILSKHE